MTTTGQAIEKGGSQSTRGVLSRKGLGGLGRLMAWWRNFVRSQLLAEGYEDTEGFHFGKEPHPNCVNLDQFSRKAEERKMFETTWTSVHPSQQGNPVSVSVTRVDSPARERKE